MAPAFAKSAHFHTAPSVRRALHAIRSHAVPPDQIDYAILSAINVTLCLISGADDRVAEGFNRDCATRSGRRPPSE